MRTHPVVMAVVGMALVAAGAAAQESWVLRAQAAEQEGAERQRQVLEARKQALAEQAMQLRQQAGNRGEFDPSFTRYWIDKLMGLSLDRLEELVATGGEGDLNLLTGSFRVVPVGGVPEALGDSGRDLVFTKVSPCRIVDTRNAGGAMGSASARDFYVAGTAGFDGQGGLAGGCGIPQGATAVSLNLVAVSPAGYGWLRAYPWGGTPPTASVINYTGGTDIANGLIQPICDPASATCTYDLTLRADAAGTHVVIDVMGYFMRVDKAQYRTFTVHNATSSVVGMPADPSCGNYWSLSITAPAAGRIIVRAHTNIRISHTNGTVSQAQFGIANSSTSCSFVNGYSSFQLLPLVTPTATYYFWDSAHWSYDVTTPGTYTFYLNGRTLSGSADFYTAGMMATFHPQ